MKFKYRNLASVSFIALVLSGTVFEVSAGEPVGTVKSVVGAARVERGTLVVQVIVGLSIEANDRIVTANASSVGMTLKDDTLIAIGPRSTFTFDSFAFNPTTQLGNLSVKLWSGTMRMVSGLIGRQKLDAVSVSTRSATIGIRGTDFIVEVPGDE